MISNMLHANVATMDQDQIEQVVALYIHMADQGTENSSLEQYAKLIRGIQNNSAIFLPDIELSANFKRNAAREWGYKLGAGQTYADAPFAVLPARESRGIPVICKTPYVRALFQAPQRCHAPRSRDCDPPDPDHET